MISTAFWDMSALRLPDAFGSAPARPGAITDHDMPARGIVEMSAWGIVAAASAVPART
jgi:hypothetical protein